MQVHALDHVNIVAADLAGSARFYAELLGLEARPGPPPMTPETGQWLYNDAGTPVIHLNSVDCGRPYDRSFEPATTGAIHHVALRCTGYDDLVGRLREWGVDHQANEVSSIGLRQVFTHDPNGVLLELNFFGD